MCSCQGEGTLPSNFLQTFVCLSEKPQQVPIQGSLLWLPSLSPPLVLIR